MSTKFLIVESWVKCDDASLKCYVENKDLKN